MILAGCLSTANLVLGGFRFVLRGISRQYGEFEVERKVEMREEEEGGEREEGEGGVQREQEQLNQEARRRQRQMNEIADTYRLIIEEGGYRESYNKRMMAELEELAVCTPFSSAPEDTRKAKANGTTSTCAFPCRRV